MTNAFATFFSWKNLLLTGAFCVAIAWFITALGLSEGFLGNVVVSCLIGFTVSGANHLLTPIFDRFMHIGMAAGLATLVGIGAGLALAGQFAFSDALFFFAPGNGTWILAVFFGLVGYAVFAALGKAASASQALAESEAALALQERKAVEANLKVLQAQIEPHFLFNTLSNVVGMIPNQPQAAEETLINLTKLLRSSLNRTREEVATLGDELDLITAYLEIQRIRMNERLTFSVNVEATMRDLPLPPLLLQPLVENALKHGIDPLEAGGNIKITVETTATLKITVTDSGVGIAGTSQGGTGLENVKQRLRAIYQDKASLSLTDNQPSGTVATLNLPLETDDRADRPIS